MKRKVIIDRVDEIRKGLLLNKVTLEDLSARDESRDVVAIVGRIRVSNLEYAKHVFARITFDDWASHEDYIATYTESNEDGSNDAFAFGFTTSDRRHVSAEFVLSCIQNGQQFWDNNGGKNYCFNLREDLFPEPLPTQSTEPEFSTTSQDDEETSQQEDVQEAEETSQQEDVQEAEETVPDDTSSYPQFQVVPLTPEKIHFYSRREVPEKEILPAKAQKEKHVLAFDLLAFEAVPIIEEAPPEGEGDEIQAVSANVEECGVNPFEADGDEPDGEQQLVNSTAQQEQDIVVEEEAVEPIKIDKLVVDESTDEVFDKLEKEKAGNVSIDSIQVIEEPTTEDVNDGERDDTQQSTVQNAVGGDQTQQTNGVAEEQLQQTAATADADKNKKEKGKKEDKKAEKKKKGKKEKKKSKKDKPDQTTSEAEKELKRPSNTPSGDDQSQSSKREKIGDEDIPKPKKQGFLSRMACCGKAEPD